MKKNANDGLDLALGVSFRLLVLAAFCTSSFSASVPAGWKTYRSPDYGFVIAYPKDFKHYTNATDAQLAVVAICNMTTAACFEYSGKQYEGTRFEAAGVAVNILSDAHTEAECNKIDTGQYPIKTARINGIRFHYGETGGAAAGNVIGGPVYRTFHEHACFELALQVVTDNTDHGIEDYHNFDSTKMEKKLQRILHTFRFVRRSSDLPGSK